MMVSKMIWTKGELKMEYNAQPSFYTQKSQSRNIFTVPCCKFTPNDFYFMKKYLWPYMKLFGRNIPDARTRLRGRGYNRGQFCRPKLEVMQKIDDYFMKSTKGPSIKDVRPKLGLFDLPPLPPDVQEKSKILKKTICYHIIYDISMWFLRFRK